jgi:hypothetical protein
MGAFYLLQETGNFLLQENNDKIIIDGATSEKADKSLRYCIFNQLSTDKDLKYTLFNQPSISKSLRYCIITTPKYYETGYLLQESGSYILQENNDKLIIDFADNNTKTLTYKLYQSKLLTTSLKYCIIETKDKIDESLTYRVRTKTLVSESLKYCLDLNETTLTLSLGYEIFSHSWEPMPEINSSWEKEAEVNSGWTKKML